MNIKSHGVWHLYRPAKLPESAPPSALFTRRAGDGVDWYVYANSGRNFAEDSIKLTLIDGIVGAAVTDPTRLFPGNATVLEVSDVHVADPQKAFGSKVYDAERKTFRDPPPFDFPDPLADIIRRLEALERKGS